MQGPAARLLRERREVLKLTQYEVARRAGVRESDVSRWERGIVKSPPLTGMRKVCRVLGIDLDELADALLDDEEAAKRGGEEPPGGSAKPPAGSVEAFGDLDARRADRRSQPPRRRQGPRPAGER